MSLRRASNGSDRDPVASVRGPPRHRGSGGGDAGFKNRTRRVTTAGGQGHTTPRNIWCRGETSTEHVDVCVCVCGGGGGGGMEPVRWSERVQNKV